MKFLISFLSVFSSDLYKKIRLFYIFSLLSKNSDSNKYIFLPAGGLWYGATHGDAGSHGYYWSTMWDLSAYGWLMYFSSGYPSMTTSHRRNGFSVVAIR